MIDASTLILGFSGSIGSGCTYISEMIPEMSDKKYKYYKLSSVIREKLIGEGIPNPTIEQLQNTGNSLRQGDKNGVLIELLLQKIEKEIGDEGCGIVIDGIKNEGEVEVLKQFPFFFLFSVQADKDIRKDRITHAGILDEAGFLEADRRDEREEFSYGQQVKRINYLSDVILINNEDIPSAADGRKRQFMGNIYNRYIKLIENLREGEPSFDIAPTIDELAMTIAYSLSKSSSCIKRKVGALVIDIDTIKSQPEENELAVYPYIVSSGYNEVPIGSKPCIFHPTYQKCYRDYLQEESAKKMKNCPNCGKEIDLPEIICPHCNKKYDHFVKFCNACKHEIEVKYVCECGSNIFNEYLPGGKDAPGKLLDMCRALHAEELTLLKLSKSGNLSENLVLYVTTQPCNLCANKIVSSGIKRVVYSEPYLMKESEDILEKGDVTTQRFEGIKSTAYFRLYQ